MLAEIQPGDDRSHRNKWQEGFVIHQY